MPKKQGKSNKKAKKGIPSYGRAEKHVQSDLGLHKYSADVPLGNTDPTVVYGKLYGDMPNLSRMARGNLRTYRGKRT